MQGGAPGCREASVSEADVVVDNPVAETPPAQPSKRRARGKPPRGPLRLVVAILVQLLILILVLLGFVLGTQTGLRSAIGLAEDLAPGVLEVGQVDGRVLGALSLRDLSLTLPTLEVAVGALDLDWSPSALLGWTVRVRTLAARDIAIVAAPSPEQAPSTEPFELPQIRLPIGIDIDQILVERLSFALQGAADTSAIRLERAELSATAVGERVELRTVSLRMAQPVARADIRGQAYLRGDYPIELTLDWSFEQPPALALTGSGQITGDLQALKIDHRIGGSLDLTLAGSVRDALSKPAWDVRLDLSRIDLPAIAPGAPALDLSAELTSRGDLDAASIVGKVRGAAAAGSELPDLGELNADLALDWRDQVLIIQSLALTEAGSGAALELTGHADTGDAAIPFQLDAGWSGLRWPLAGEAVAASPKGSLRVDGTLDAFRYQLGAEAAGAQIPALTLTIDGDGSKQETRIKRLQVDTLGGQVVAEGRVAWSPALTWDLTLTAADIDPGRQWVGLDGRIGLQAKTDGGLDDGFDYQVGLDAALTAYPAATLAMNGTAGTETAHLEALTIDTLGGTVSAQGTVHWAGPPRWDLTLNGVGIDPGQHWAGLDGEVVLDLASKGGLADGFAFALGADARLAGIPPTTLRLSGTGDAESATTEVLEAQLLGGRIDGQATLGWAPSPRWDVALTLADLDPGKQVAAWPGRLGGRIASQGEITDAGPKATLRTQDLGGQLRGYPLRIVVDAGIDGQAVTLRTLTAASGSTKLQAGGSIDQRLDLRLTLTSPDLGTLAPEAKGSIDASGQVSGSLDAPRVRLKLNGRDLEVGGQGIEQIGGSADLGLGPGDAISARFDGSNLIVGSLRFETLGLSADGTVAAHRVSAEASGDQLDLRLALRGALADGGGYDGVLSTLAVDSELLGPWGLTRPAALAFGPDRLKLGPLCIGNGQGSGACIDAAQIAPGRIEAGLAMDRFDLAALGPLLPDLMALTGEVRAQGRFTIDGQTLSGSAQLRVPEGQIAVALADAPERIVFAGTRLDIKAGGDGINTELALPLEGIGGVDGQVALPGFRLGGGAGTAQRISGRLQLRLEDLTRLSVLAPQLTAIQGRIDGDLRIGGQLPSPRLDGRIAARGLGARVPLIGLVVSALDLDLNAAGETLTLAGEGDVGGGRLRLDGGGRLAASAPDLRLQIVGDKLKVADSKEYKAVVSLKVRVGVGAGGTAVDGEVAVRKALIKPREIPSGAVSPSADVVMEADAGGGGPPMSLNLLLRLGDDVRIDAFGLRALLSGELRVTQSPGGEILGNGQLDVTDGSYRLTLPGAVGLMTSVGRPLIIKQGIINYANTPIGNPGLVLSAQREGGDVTAGVRVVGTLRNAKLTFFSESDPDMTQAEITSYLVTGMPPRGGDGTDDRALSVGTYVAPKLFVEYESSLGDASDKVKVRYDLNNRIELQTETGDSQGADIFFKFEN